MVDGPTPHLPGPRPQPMGVGTVLEVGVRIVRRHWAALLAVALLFVGPVALLTAATSIAFNDEVDDLLRGSGQELRIETNLTRPQVERLGGTLATYLLATGLGGILATIGTIGFSSVVGADYQARRIELGEALRTCLRRAVSALGIILLTTLVIIGLIVGGVALIVLAVSVLSPGDIARGGAGAFVALVIGVTLAVAVVYLTMRWAMAMPVLAVEGGGVREGLQRSWHLTADNVWRTFLISLIGALLTALFAALVSQLLALLVVDLLSPAVGLDRPVAETVVLAVGSVLLAPLAPVLLAVLYFDLRIRRDAVTDAATSTQTP